MAGENVSVMIRWHVSDIICIEQHLLLIIFWQNRFRQSTFLMMEEAEIIPLGWTRVTEFIKRLISNCRPQINAWTQVGLCCTLIKTRNIQFKFDSTKIFELFIRKISSHPLTILSISNSSQHDPITIVTYYANRSRNALKIHNSSYNIGFHIFWCLFLFFRLRLLSAFHALALWKIQYLYFYWIKYYLRTVSYNAFMLIRG